MNMSRLDRSRRPSKKLAQGTRFLVVVEGQVTEKEYIDAIRRTRRVNKGAICIEVGYTDPISIVKRAKKIQGNLLKPDKFEQVWCVFDVEANVSQRARCGLAEALDTASRTSNRQHLQCAVSNPCFEIWLLWHATDQTAPIGSANVQRQCQSQGITSGRDGKRLQNPEILIRNGLQSARTRAIAMEDTHDKNRSTTPEDRNPSSGVFKLIDAIYAAFPPR